MTLIRESPGLSDREIRERTGISPHQQINQITNRLAKRGEIRRVLEGGVLRNYPLGYPTPQPRGEPRATPSPRSLRPPHQERAAEDWHVPSLSTGRPLLVLPCSSRKHEGGAASGGPSVTDLLPDDLASALRDRRDAVAARARVTPGALMPARKRYNGHLYQAAGGALEELAGRGIPTVIISGGYGLVLADEPIGWYDRRFQPKDWPARLIPQCLAALARAQRVDRVVCLAGTSTPYAHVTRQALWQVEAVLLTPSLRGGGAMQRAPRAIGEAVRALAGGDIDAGWRSSGGVPLRREPLR